MKPADNLDPSGRSPKDLTGFESASPNASVDLGNLPVVVAISGGSGAAYAKRLLQVLGRSKRDVHLVISSAGAQVVAQEFGIALDLKKPDLATFLELSADQLSRIHYHASDNYFCPIASGSFRTAGMVICPCSGSTLSAVAHGTSANLIQRAAEVHLKERRKLVLVPRETPLSRVALKNMLEAHDAGATILPASPGWYHGVQTFDDLFDFVVGRILDQLQIDNGLINRWGE